jgi:hypothetical protein
VVVPRLRSGNAWQLDRPVRGEEFAVVFIVLMAIPALPLPTGGVTHGFSGLDTLPALGVVVVALGVLLEDVVLAAVGLVIGAVGAVLVIALGSLVVRLLQQLV